MLTKERLKKYQKDRAYMNSLYAQPDMVTDTVKGSSAEAPYTVRSVTVTGIDMKRRSRMQAIEARCAMVEAEVMLTPDSVRELLWLRYMDGLHWDQVGQRVGLNPDTCRIRCDRYLETEPQP